jgi:tRNA G18 (ribose-2'-O)-methylase SpoU
MRPLQDHALALIIGNEVAGIDPGLLAASDQIVQLPMLGHKRSLNVASAAAIALYQLRFGIPSSSPTSFHQ